MSDGIYSSLLGNCKKLPCAQAEKERDGLRGRRRVESVRDGERDGEIEKEENKEVRD